MKERIRTAAKALFTRSETYFCLLLAGLLAAVLFSPDIAGVADNGDFNRVLRPTLMWYQDGLSDAQRYFNYVMEEYQILFPGGILLPIYLNTHAVVVQFAKILNVLLGSPTVFHIRVLAGVYSVLLLWGAFLLMRGIKSRFLWVNILLFSLVVFVFGDSGHLLYFNSLFAEPAAFVFFLLSAGYALKIVREQELKISSVIFFFCALTMFLGTKAQYAPLAVLFIPIAYYIAKRLPLRREKIAVWAMLGGTVVCSVTLYLVQPAYLDEVTTFDSVFCGIANDPATAGDRLEELGLPREYEVLAGMDGFQAEYPIDIQSEEFRENFYDKIGKGTLVKYYLTHFDLFWQEMERTGKELYYNRPEYLGNRAESYSAERASYTAFSGYQQIKNAVFPRSVWFILGFFVLYFAGTVWYFIRRKGTRQRTLAVFLMILMVFCAIQYVLPTVGNGGIDIAKQLYLFNVVFDFLLVFAVASGVGWLCRRLGGNGAITAEQ